MSIMPIWINLVVVVVALSLTMMGSLRWAEAAYAREQDRRKQQARQRWLPLRMSNCLMGLSAVYCVMACLQRPPFGSVLELFVCTWVIAAGAVLSAKGY